MSPYEIIAKWNGSGGWYYTLELTIKNNTNQNVKAPKISFDTRNISNISGNINVHDASAFNQETFTGIIKGKLAAHAENLEANSSRTIGFGFNFNLEELDPPLPINFTFNGELIGAEEPVIPDPEPEPGISKLVQNDELTDYTYKRTGFNPETETTKFSYTSARVLKDVYNKYQTDGKVEVGGYYTSWSQYDARLDNKDSALHDIGRGVDIKKHYNHNYDKMVLGFFAIKGDKGEKGAVITKSANELGLKQSEMTTVGNWDQIAAGRNCGFTNPLPISNEPTDYLPFFSQDKTQGALGAFRNLKDLGTAGTKFALSIGGWTMSEAFHDMAKDPSTRKIFSDSVVKFLEKFPMYKQIDIDWEYPGAPGIGNPHGPEDGQNYVSLVQELRKALNDSGHSDVAIAIAAAADPTKLALSNIKELIDAGLDQIHLMTYDLYGGTYGNGKLAHHSSLYDNGSNNGWSIDQSVQYLKNQGIDMKHVHIGYAGYSRNARDAEIESVSPLKGTFTVAPNIVGSFENGVTENYDIYANYFDPSTGKGKNGFILYTDTVANADFLYNPTSKVFISFDTPRTVKAKAEYAVKNGLGGVFTWTIDQDNGLLSNAAHEGLGHNVVTENIDMSELYFAGETSLVERSFDTI